MIQTLTLILISYLLGSINSAILVCKILQLPSPRSIGSGNPGATNVLRLGGKKAAALTLFGDVLKGIIPVVISHLLGLSVLALGLVALAAVIGHIFPVFFSFKGGKGVATYIGTIIGLNPFIALAFLAVWLIIAGLFRYSSLAALVATLLCPIYAFWFMGPNILLPITLISLLVIIRHYENIKRLYKGEESRIGEKKS